MNFLNLGSKGSKRDERKSFLLNYIIEHGKAPSPTDINDHYHPKEVVDKELFEGSPAVNSRPDLIYDGYKARLQALLTSKIADGTINEEQAAIMAQQAVQAIGQGLPADQLPFIEEV